jgi:hypothetical protein
MNKFETKRSMAKPLNRGFWLVLLHILLPLNAAHAFDMCKIFRLTPSAVSDYDRLVGEVETVTGCRALPRETVHERRWACADDATTAQLSEAATLVLIREPSVSAHLVVFFVGQTNLDFLRDCPGFRLTRGLQFQPGNIGLRDQGRIGEHGSTKLTLTSIIPSWGSVIVSDNANYPVAAPFEISTWEWAHGYTATKYLDPALSTPVRIAGSDPVSQPVEEVVAALIQRGAVQKSYASGRTNLRRDWELSAPNGLPGVDLIQINSVLRHIISVKYTFTSASEYERYIGLLDEQYGTSSRMRVGRCSNRIWLASAITISGEYCSGSTTLTFFNIGVSTSFVDIVNKLSKEDEGAAAPKEKIIDRDNF